MALPLWWCFYRMLCAAVAVWHCPTLFSVLAVWFGFHLMYSGCCVALPLSCLQLAVLLLNLMYNGCGVALPLPCLQRLCDFASILCTAVAVWHLPYPVTAQKRHSTLQQEKSKSTRQLLYIE